MIAILLFLAYAIYEMLTSDGVLQWCWSLLRFGAVMTLGVVIFSERSENYTAAVMGFAVVGLLGMWAMRSEVQSRDP